MCGLLVVEIRKKSVLNKSKRICGNGSDRRCKNWTGRTGSRKSIASRTKAKQSKAKSKLNRIFLQKTGLP